MFPLKQQKLIRGTKEHIAAGLGVAADYAANYDNLYLPFDGIVERFYGPQGGNWLRLIRSDNRDKIEFAHLSKYLVINGIFKAGTLIAITGNSGELTTGPHLHIQILKNNNRIDPQGYDWGDNMTLGFKKQDDPTVYVQVGSKLVPIADWEAFISLGGSADSVISLTPDQFSRFDVGSHTLFKSN